jgi:hypothetical protein
MAQGRKDSNWEVLKDKVKQSFEKVAEVVGSYHGADDTVPAGKKRGTRSVNAKADTARPRGTRAAARRKGGRAKTSIGKRP